MSQFQADGGLQAGHSFPPLVMLGDQQYTPLLYAGQALPDTWIAFDCETELIRKDDPEHVPQLALATAYGNRGSCYLIHPDQVGRFILAGADRHWVGHNVVFDFSVVDQHLRQTSHREALAAWWQIAADGRLHDTMLLERLIALARTDEPPERTKDLGNLAQHYLGVRLDKDDPYRLRYAELLGIPAEQWPQLDPGFFSYAIKDPICTLLVYQRLWDTAKQLQPQAVELLPGAAERFGLLTETLQVRGAIALAAVSRAGVQVDLDQVAAVRDQIGHSIADHSALLEQLATDLVEADIFKGHNGKLVRTAAGVPRKNAKVIKSALEQIASDLGISPRRNQDGLVTDSVRFWEQYADDHPFIRAYVDWAGQSKLAQFLVKLAADRIYPRYTPLVRTGRCSCREPNLQQLPRSNNFREMIIPAPDHWLLAIDYATLELRTLAQTCLRRYGFSRLAEVFTAGGDPHTHTAMMLQRLTAEQFAALPKPDQKAARQRAKAINFGVPGGLGAPALMTYARSAYGVEMILGEAKQLRLQLITQIYPELDHYLTEDRWQTAAVNMHVPCDTVRTILPDYRLFEAGLKIIGSEEVAGKFDEKQRLLMWETVTKLNKNPELEPLLQQQKADEALARQLFFGNAVTLSGRVRGHVRFAARCNAPFQGLAADGAKLALFELIRAEYRVVGFVHDEVLIEIPKTWDLDLAYQHVSSILCDRMRQLTPDVPISCDGLLADRWYKDTDEQPRDVHGRIVPYQERPDTEVTKPARQSVASPPEGTGLTKNKPAARSTDSNTKSTKPKKRRCRPAYDPDSIYSFFLPREA